jgi:hypothetical protein
VDFYINHHFLKNLVRVSPGEIWCEYKLNLNHQDKTTPSPFRQVGINCEAKEKRERRTLTFKGVKLITH